MMNDARWLLIASSKASITKARAKLTRAATARTLKHEEDLLRGAATELRKASFAAKQAADA